MASCQCGTSKTNTWCTKCLSRLALPLMQPDCRCSTLDLTGEMLATVRPPCCPFLFETSLTYAHDLQRTRLSFPFLLKTGWALLRSGRSSTTRPRPTTQSWTRHLLIDVKRDGDATARKRKHFSKDPWKTFERISRRSVCMFHTTNTVLLWRGVYDALDTCCTNLL